MPAFVTVWAVELGRGSSLEEVKGTLSLEGGELVFEPRSDKARGIRIAARDILKASRLRGSPVLMVLHRHGDRQMRTAFYFVQPPPMQVPAGAALRPSPFFTGKTSRRRVRRQNVSYFGLWNQEKKPVVREWEREVREAMAAAPRDGG